MGEPEGAKLRGKNRDPLFYVVFWGFVPLWFAPSGLAQTAQLRDEISFADFCLLVRTSHSCNAVAAFTRAFHFSTRMP